MLRRWLAWRKIDKAAKKGPHPRSIVRHEVARFSIPLSKPPTKTPTKISTKTSTKDVKDAVVDKTYAAWMELMMTEHKVIDVALKVAAS